MNCGLCDNKATYAYKTEGRGWSGRCVQCYDNATPLLRSFLKRIIPMCQGRELSK